MIGTKWLKFRLHFAQRTWYRAFRTSHTARTSPLARTRRRQRPPIDGAVHSYAEGLCGKSNSWTQP